jgi:hypothetical protein
MSASSQISGMRTVVANASHSRLARLTRPSETCALRHTLWRSQVRQYSSVLQRTPWFPPVAVSAKGLEIVLRDGTKLVSRSIHVRTARNLKTAGFRRLMASAALQSARLAWAMNSLSRFVLFCVVPCAAMDCTSLLQAVQDQVAKMPCMSFDYYNLMISGS